MRPCAVRSNLRAWLPPPGVRRLPASLGSFRRRRGFSGSCGIGFFRCDSGSPEIELLAEDVPQRAAADGKDMLAPDGLAEFEGLRKADVPQASGKSAGFDAGWFGPRLELAVEKDGKNVARRLGHREAQLKAPPYSAIKQLGMVRRGDRRRCANFRPRFGRTAVSRRAMERGVCAPSSPRLHILSHQQPLSLEPQVRAVNPRRPLRSPPGFVYRLPASLIQGAHDGPNRRRPDG